METEVTIPTKKVLGFNPRENGFCSSETKYDRKTARRPKLFASARRLQEQRPQPQKKTVLWTALQIQICMGLGYLLYSTADLCVG
jgi:hypothetical protein